MADGRRGKQSGLKGKWAVDGIVSVCHTLAINKEDEMNRAEMNEHIVGLLLNALPDETIQIGQRLRRHQVEVLNLAIVRAKYERPEKAE
jgi:hypothetical protein